MNNEIKEILDKMNNIKDITCDCEILTYYESGLLLDYITNLQEENERLKEILHWKQIENNIFYKSRIDKAIEEKKIPEKIKVKDYDKCIHNVTHKEKEFSLDIRELQITYNDLLDYLKSKGENNDI